MAINRNDRAKQFHSFDALSGLSQALREKEKEYVDKIELSEEVLDDMSKVFHKLEHGTNIEVVYYKNRQYHTKVNRVLKIDYIKKAIILNDETNVFFDDILKLKII